MNKLAGVFFFLILSLNSLAQSSFEIKTQEDLRIYILRQTPEYNNTVRLCKNLNPEVLNKNPLNIREMSEFKNVIQASAKMNMAYQELFYSRFKEGFNYVMNPSFFKDFLSDNEDVSSLTRKLFSSEGFAQAMNECFGQNNLPLNAHVFMLSIVMSDVLGQTASLVTTAAIFKGINYLRLAIAAKYGKTISHLMVTAPVGASSVYGAYKSFQNIDKSVVFFLSADDSQYPDSRNFNKNDQLNQLKELLKDQKNAVTINPDLIARLEARISQLERKK